MEHPRQTHDDLDLFEINFNNKKVVDSALDAPIKCGFEAETLWPFVRVKKNAEWDQVKELLPEHEVEKIQSRYRDWLEPKVEWELKRQIENLADDRIQDETYTDEFFNQLDEKAIQQFQEFRDEKYDIYRRKNLPGFDDPEWWKGTFIRVRMDREFRQWVREQIQDTDLISELKEVAFQAVSNDEDGTIDYWVEQHYATWAAALEYFDIELKGISGITTDPIKTVAQEVFNWTKDNSKFRKIKYGRYHANTGLNNDFWRVESDSSIKPGPKQSGAEIISPVYDSPREMLAEMKKLFELFNESGVETDQNTGLHVTMSWYSNETTTGTNRLKMAVLLGDQYLLQQFQRLGNMYSKSQMDNLQKAARLVKNDTHSSEDWENLERFFKNNISADKFSSINFKNLKNTMGHELMEFRIMGNQDYQQDFKKVIKAVTRYAAVMQAGHDKDLYNKDYIKAVAKLFITSPQELTIPKTDQEFAQKIVDWESVNPNVLSAFQEVSNRKYYTNISELLSSAYKLMKIAKRRRADNENNIIEAADYTWEDFFKVARENFVEAVFLLVLMLLDKSNRAPIKAKQAIAFRQAVKDFEYTPEQLWEELQQIPRYRSKINISGDHFEKSKMFAQAFNSMLKMNAAKSPEPKVSITFNPRNELLFLHPKLNKFLEINLAVKSSIRDRITKQHQLDDPAKLRSMIGIATKEQYFDILDNMQDFEDVISEINQLRNTVIPTHKQNLSTSTTDRDREINQGLIDSAEAVLQNKIKFIADHVRLLKQFILEYGFLPSTPAIKKGIKDTVDSGILPSLKMPREEIFWIRYSTSGSVLAELAKVGIKIKTDINASKQFSESTAVKQKSEPRMKTKKIEIPVIKEDLNLFEINFNDKSLISSALNAPIKCGFEAETTWPDVQAADDDGDWLEGKTWREVSDLIYDQEGSRAVQRIEEAYREWLMETDYFLNAESNVIDDLVSERREDEYYLDDYVSSRVSESDIEDYKEQTLDELKDKIDYLEQQAEQEESDPNGEPKLVDRLRRKAQDVQDDIADREDWDMDAWGREYVEEEMQEDYEEWLADGIRENGEQWDDAWEKATQAADVDRYMEDVHGSWYDLLRTEDIYLVNEEAGGLDEVASILEDWAINNSMSDDVRPGDYHSGQGVDNTYWRVESDSSIEGEGAGAEIISPVYDSPADMLREMKSLFEFFESENVETNDSTGLHITMSWTGDTNVETNRLKMALLLGDKYVAKQFGRESNSYTKSQLDNIKHYLSNIKNNINDKKSLQALEELISGGVSTAKLSSINFKNNENVDGNKLIEFRVAGGDDYHTMMDAITKTVIRYGTVMQAGHDPNAFRRDYVNAIFRLINSQLTVGKDRIKKIRDLVNTDGINTKVLNAFETLLSDTNYYNTIKELGNAYAVLADATILKDTNPQKELELGEDVQDQEYNSADDWRTVFKLARVYFAKAFAMLLVDVASNSNRATPRAAQIAALRSAAKDFGFTSETLWNKILGFGIIRAFPGNHYEKLKLLADTMNSLLKQQVQVPEPLFTINISPGQSAFLAIDKYEDLMRFRSKVDIPTQEDFRVAPKDEAKDAVRAIVQSRNGDEFIENFELRILSLMQQHDQDNQLDQDKQRILATVDVLKDKLKVFQDELDQHNKVIQQFVEKYKFAPADMHEQDIPFFKYLTDNDMDNISASYNIKFDTVKNQDVFEIFDKMSLQEKIMLIDKVSTQKINEAFSRVQEALPNFNPPQQIKQLLATHFPVSDLDKQMIAYTAIPVPEMLDAFRSLHAQLGPDACARDILRYYAQNYYSQPVREAKVIDVSKSFVTAKDTDREFRKLKKNSKLMPRMVLGKYPARLVKVSPGGKSYTLFVMDQDDKQPIMYFELYYLGFAYIVNIARLRKKFQGQGLGKEIYASLVKDLKMTLVSDEQQSPGAKQVWTSLAKTPGINVYAWVSQQGFRKAKFMPVDVDDLDQMETADGYAYFDRDDIDLLKMEMQKELRAADSSEQRKQISKKYKDEIKSMFDAIPVRIVATPQRGINNSTGKAK